MRLLTNVTSTTTRFWLDSEVSPGEVLVVEGGDWVLDEKVEIVDEGLIRTDSPCVRRGVEGTQASPHLVGTRVKVETN